MLVPRHNLPMRIVCALAIVAVSVFAQDAEKFYSSIGANDLVGLKGTRVASNSNSWAQEN